MILLGRDYEETNKLLSDDDIIELTSGGWEVWLAELEERRKITKRRRTYSSSTGLKYVMRYSTGKWASNVAIRAGKQDSVPPSKAGSSYIGGGQWDSAEEAGRASDK